MSAIIASESRSDVVTMRGYMPERTTAENPRASALLHLQKGIARALAYWHQSANAPYDLLKRKGIITHLHSHYRPIPGLPGG